MVCLHGITRIHKYQDSSDFAAAPRNPHFEVAAYYSKMLKVIPIEIIMLYRIGTGIIPNNNALISILWLVFCTATLIRIRASTTRARLGDTQRDAVLVSVIAFIIFAYSLGCGGWIASIGIYTPWVGSIAIVAWGAYIMLWRRSQY